MNSDFRVRRVSVARRLTAGLCAVLLAFQLGCHSYLPLQETVPVAGREIAVELNDRGRLMVAGQLGEAVLRVDGTLLAATDSMITMSVARTVQLQGSSALWTGETVQVPTVGIRGYRMREFSRARTVALTGAIVLTVLLLATVFDLNVGGGTNPEDPVVCPPDCPTDR